MQASDRSSASLHQKASAQYLEGKFDEALATWKQVLTAEPENESAKEGVRLCELLTAGDTAEGEAQPDSDVPAFDEPIDFEVPDMADATPSPPDVAHQTIEIEPDAITAAPAAPAASFGSADESDVGSIVDGIFDDESPSGDAQPAAADSELQDRIGAMMQEARSAHERGDTDEVRSLLSCIFILDEANPDALQLQEQIENGIPAVTEQVVVSDLDAPDHHAPPGEFDLTADAPVAAAAPVDEGGSPEPGRAAEVQTTEEPDLEPLTEADDEIVVDGLSQPADPGPAKRKIKLPQFDLRSSKSRWIVIGAVVGVFVVVGAGFWIKLRSIEIRDVPPPVVRPATPAKQVETTPEPATAVENEPADEPAAAATEAPDVTPLLARGNAAFDEGDYAAAILAFDAVLKQQPGDVEATERMAAATEAYRKQQEGQKQWVAAKALFRDGDYRPALQMFYRLPVPDAESRIALDRYMENSWYNMGLLALRSRQCELAREHFGEAAQIDPKDADLETVLSLCDACDSGRTRAGYQRAANAMPLRGLDD